MKKNVRAPIVLGIGLLLSGCSNDVWHSVQETWAVAGKGKPNEGITADYVRDLPYASLLVQIEPRAQALAVLASADANKLTWQDASANQLVMEGGRVRHLSIDQQVYHIHSLQGVDPVASLTWPRDAVQSYAVSIDIPFLQHYHHIFHCQLYPTKMQQTIKTFLRETDTLKFDEICTDRQQTRIHNQYWVDNQDQVVESRYNLFAKLPGALVLKEAKPYQP